MGHVFNTHWLCCYQIRWQRGKQYANPGVCEQITDVKTDMAAVVLAKNTQQESDDWVTEYVRQKKVQCTTNDTRCFLFTYGNLQGTTRDGQYGLKKNYPDKFCHSGDNDKKS